VSDITVSDILDAEHLPVLFHIPDHISARDILAPVEIHADSERFRSLASEFISPRIQIDTVDEAQKAACNIEASIASAYQLSTRKITLSELNNELPKLDILLQLKHRLRKLWHETGIQHVKVKVKVKLSLCLTKHHAKKTYWGSGGITPRILDLGTTWR
jgi:hypothetical protein